MKPIWKNWISKVLMMWVVFDKSVIGIPYSSMGLDHFENIKRLFLFIETASKNIVTHPGYSKKMDWLKDTVLFFRITNDMNLFNVSFGVLPLQTCVGLFIALSADHEENTTTLQLICNFNSCHLCESKLNSIKAEFAGRVPLPAEYLWPELRILNLNFFDTDLSDAYFWVQETHGTSVVAFMYVVSEFEVI